MESNKIYEYALNQKPDPPFYLANRTTHLATCRHLHPWMKGMRTAVQVAKFVLHSPPQVRTKRNPDIASLRAWILLAGRQPPYSLSYLHPRRYCTMSKTKQKSDVASLRAWTKHRDVKDEAKSDIASLRAWTKHVLPYPSSGTFSSQMRGVCKFTLLPSSTPSSEDDVLSRPARETMTPSSVEAPSPIPVDEGVTYHHRITTPLF